MKRLIHVAASCAVLILTGCASVKVMKVNDDKAQPEGFPFYLPRPYVQVYEPFVVSSKVFLAAGQVSSDGQFLLLDNVTSDLGGTLSADIGKESKIKFPMSSVQVRPPQAAYGGAPQAANDNTTSSFPAENSSSKDETNGGGSKPDADKPNQNGAGKEGSESVSSNAVGQFNTSVTQSPLPFSPTLGRRFFDVVWMPDFAEKYVIQGHPGLGNSNIGITMVQGWGLYGLDAKIDNSAIVKPLLDFYSTGLDALSKLAKSKIFPASVLTGAPQAGNEGQPRAEALTPGTRVSVKVTKVAVAAPGLYPILKPTEAKQVAEVSRVDSPEARVLVPMRPYTNVAFNVYEVLVVEAAKPTGDSPMNLQRYFDQDLQANSNSSSSNTPGSRADFDVNAFTTAANEKLKDEKGVDGAYWVLSDVKSKDNKLLATATLTGGKQKPTNVSTTAKLLQFLSILSKQFAVGDIVLTEK